MEMNNNINDERVKYWQDHFDNVLWSRGMLLFCNTLIVMVMLIYSYTADPASNDEINICRDVFKNNTNTDYDCLNIYDKLQISQSNAVSQRILIIVFGCIIYMITIILKYLKNLGIVVRANGLVSWKGALSTIIGTILFAYFIGRCFTCYSLGEGPWFNRMYCAKSKSLSFRVMNDTIINILIMAFSTFIFYIVRQILNIENWSEYLSNSRNNIGSLFSIDSINKMKHNAIYLFYTQPPPPYDNTDENTYDNGSISRVLIQSTEGLEQVSNTSNI